MPRERIPDLQKAGISDARVKELLAFCEQYPEKKRVLGEMLYASPPPGDGQPKGNRVGDPTYQMAAKRDRLFQECAIIEQAAIEACPHAYQAFLRYITDRKTYKISILPYGTTEAYAIRKAFLIALHEKRNTLGT